MAAAVVFVLACGSGGLRVKFTSPDGAVRLDRDGDGFAGPWECTADVPSCRADELNRTHYQLADLDCNDRNASIHPGAPDVPGDGIDSNCDGEDGVRRSPPHEAGELTLPGQAPAHRDSLTTD